MSDEGTQLCNPFSTGGGGPNFENQVQASFVVLMLSGGIVPCVPPWQVKEIKLQGRYANYNTDDFIVTTEEQNGGRKAKLLGQIKHSVNFTENDPIFREVIEAGWRDFQNPQLFDPEYDAIALITGPLSTIDVENTRPLLEWARASASAQEFLDKVGLGKFSSERKRSKLKAFRAQITKANKGVEVKDEELWRFLKTYHILSYDLDTRSGVTLSLLHSHISQFSIENIPELWALIAKDVEFFNQNAGTITRDTISEATRTAFSERLRIETMPKSLRPPKVPPPPAQYAVGSKEAEAIMFASLLGAWSDKSGGDNAAISKLIDGNV